MSTRLVAALGALALATAAQAATITFSFADPSGGQQLSNVANGASPGVGRMTYDTTAPITFIVDSSTEGQTVFTNSRLEFTNFNLGTAMQINSFNLAQVTGSFTFYQLNAGVRTNLLTGTATNGAFVNFNGSNAMMFNSSNGFSYTAGPGLSTILAGEPLGGLQDAGFTITNLQVSGGGPLTNAGGVFNSFLADTSYSGSSNTIPTPGSLAIVAMAAGTIVRRRR